MNGPAAVIDSTCVADMKETKKRASIEVAPLAYPSKPCCNPTSLNDRLILLTDVYRSSVSQTPSGCSCSNPR